MEAEGLGDPDDPGSNKTPISEKQLSSSLVPGPKAALAHSGSSKLNELVAAYAQASASQAPAMDLAEDSKEE